MIKKKAIKPEFVENWSCEDDVFSDFCIDEHISGPNPMKGVKILFACYKTGGYSGQGFVLFKKGRKYYEVNGSHCSCYGLEGQWSPEEVVMKELITRAERNMSCCENEYYNELNTFLQKNFVKRKEVCKKKK